MGIEDVEARLLALALDYDPLKRDTHVNLDPFWGAYTQTNRMKAYCEVFVGGVDITNKIDPHLISVRIVDGPPDFACELEVDDRDGRLPIPPIGTSLDVRLGWAREMMIKVYDGVIMDVEHGFGRKQGGRRMWIHGKGYNVLTKLKQPMDDNKGDGVPPGKKEGEKIPLTDWLQQVSKNGDVKAIINPFFEKFKQDHWAMMGASPMHEITSLADKFGAMVKWSKGNQVEFMMPGEYGLSCRAVWRDNLIGWRVRPFAARTAWKGPQTHSFDAKTGQWLRQAFDAVGKAIGPVAQAAAQGGGVQPSASQADAAQQGDVPVHSQNKGRIVINGEPAARFNSLVSLEGARPGVDGQYHIVVAEHIYSRQGYVTWLDVDPMTAGPSGTNVFEAWPLPRPNPNQG